MESHAAEHVTRATLRAVSPGIRSRNESRLYVFDERTDKYRMGMQVRRRVINQFVKLYPMHFECGVIMIIAPRQQT